MVAVPIYVRSFFPLIALAVVGCGLEDGGTLGGPDGTVDATIEASSDATLDVSADTTTDAPDDAQPSDAPSDVTTSDADAGDAETDAGSDAAPDSGSDSGVPLYGCDGGFVTDCSQCMGATMPCVYCQTDGGSLHAQHCIPFVNGTHCSNTEPAGYQTCPCNNNPQQCPAGFEVCHNGSECRTCGENNTNAETCKKGGMCVENDGGCF